jgi:1-phosphatidylinositol phosphodiesterase
MVKKIFLNLLMGIGLIIINNFVFSVNEVFADSRWMSTIRDDKPLSRVAVPGTHDSGTFKMSDPIISALVRTQEQDFRQQLEQGIRFFDIRGRATKNNQIVLHHGPKYLLVTLHQFLQEAENFLRNNPSETIIMSLKEEHPAMEEVTKSFFSIFKESYFNYYPFYTGNSSNPKIQETRGKIVLFDRTGNSTLPGYNKIYNWEDNATFQTTTNNTLPLYVQDEYNATYNRKTHAILDLLKTSSESNEGIFLNYVSLATGGTAWSSPYYFASYLNPLTGGYINEFHVSNPGWIVMDYSGNRWNPNLTKKVIETNRYLQ